MRNRLNPGLPRWVLGSKCVRFLPAGRREIARGLILTDYSLDIQRDGKGEFFELRVPTHLSDTLDVTVMQSEPKQRHLLLFVRKPGDKPQLDRFLCGHDEREWFVAAVPGGASSVRQAMDALQPAPVRQALASHKVSTNKRYSRKNRAFRRQGEWFFVPEPTMVVIPSWCCAMSRFAAGLESPHGGAACSAVVAKPFTCPSSTRTVSCRTEYKRLLKSDPSAARWGWRVMRRNTGVYARGAVSHGDHATITLPFWHRVMMNTETQSRTMANVAFLD